MKRLLALLLGLLTVFGAMPAFAAENEEFIIEGTNLSNTSVTAVTS